MRLEGEALVYDGWSFKYIHSREADVIFFLHHFLPPLLCIVVNSSYSPPEGKPTKCFIPFISKLSFHLVEIFTGIHRDWSLCLCRSTYRCRDIEGPWELMVVHLELAEHLQPHWYPQRSWALSTFQSDSSPLSRSMLDTGRRPQKSMGSSSHFANRKHVTCPNTQFYCKLMFQQMYQ